MQRIALSVFLIVAISCKSATLPSQEPTLESWVSQHLGAGFVIQKNKGETFAICSKDSNQNMSTSYYIVRIIDFTVVEKDNIQKAVLSWMDEMHVEIKITPGIVTRNDETAPSKVIDLNKYKIDKL